MDFDSEIDSFEKKSNEDALGKISDRLLKIYKEAVFTKHEIEELQELVKKRSEYLRKLCEEDMPEIFSEAGISSITLEDGKQVKVQTDVHCGIPAATKDLALNWLRENNFGDLIKNELVVKFGRSEDNVVSEVCSAAEKLGLSTERKEKVEPMTLKAFAKEQMRLGKPLPSDLFGIFIRRVVNIK